MVSIRIAFFLTAAILYLQIIRSHGQLATRQSFSVSTNNGGSQRPSIADAGANLVKGATNLAADTVATVLGGVNSIIDSLASYTQGSQQYFNRLRRSTESLADGILNMSSSPVFSLTDTIGGRLSNGRRRINAGSGLRRDGYGIGTNRFGSSMENSGNRPEFAGISPNYNFGSLWGNGMDNMGMQGGSFPNGASWSDGFQNAGQNGLLSGNMNAGRLGGQNGLLSDNTNAGRLGGQNGLLSDNTNAGRLGGQNGFGYGLGSAISDAFGGNSGLGLDATGQGSGLGGTISNLLTTNGLGFTAQRGPGDAISGLTGTTSTSGSRLSGFGQGVGSGLAGTASDTAVNGLGLSGATGISGQGAGSGLIGSLASAAANGLGLSGGTSGQRVGSGLVGAVADAATNGLGLTRAIGSGQGTGIGLSASIPSVLSGVSVDSGNGLPLSVDNNPLERSETNSTDQEISLSTRALPEDTHTENISVSTSLPGSQTQGSQTQGSQAIRLPSQAYQVLSSIPLNVHAISRRSVEQSQNAPLGQIFSSQSSENINPISSIRQFLNGTNQPDLRNGIPNVPLANLTETYQLPNLQDYWNQLRPQVQNITQQLRGGSVQNSFAERFANLSDFPHQVDFRNGTLNLPFSNLTSGRLYFPRVNGSNSEGPFQLSNLQDYWTQLLPQMQNFTQQFHGEGIQNSLADRFSNLSDSLANPEEWGTQFSEGWNQLVTQLGGPLGGSEGESEEGRNVNQVNRLGSPLEAAAAQPENGNINN